MWERFKFWFMGYKNCAGCCLGCSCYEQCKADVLREGTEEEAYERDMTMEEVMKEKMPEYHRKSA